jgi:hypothetical protein
VQAIRYVPSNVGSGTQRQVHDLVRGRYNDIGRGYSDRRGGGLLLFIVLLSLLCT